MRLTKTRQPRLELLTKTPPRVYIFNGAVKYFLVGQYSKDILVNKIFQNSEDACCTFGWFAYGHKN